MRTRKLTRTRIWLLAGVGVSAVGAALLGVDALPLIAFTTLAAAAILLMPRRVPVRDRPFEGFDDGKDLTRFGWGHPMATSMLWGATAFGWLNGTGSSAGTGSEGFGGIDGLGAADSGGGDFGGCDGGGGSE
ncbi:MAG: hypothetical protein EXR66_03230 [Dehalococcoidia bacterium]|nr:hypothetical protein [Dehalococcoidia bacterium]